MFERQQYSSSSNMNQKRSHAWWTNMSSNKIPSLTHVRGSIGTILALCACKHGVYMSAEMGPPPSLKPGQQAC